MALTSMTGFGEARSEAENLAVSVELRTVNSRYFKLHLRTPEGFGALEAKIEPLLRDRIKRGTTNCTVRLNLVGRAEDFRFNTDVLDAYIDQLQSIASKRGLPEELRVEPLAVLPGVIQEQTGGRHDAETLWPLIEKPLQAAAEQLGAMRLAEGEALAADLTQQCTAIETALGEIESRAPVVAENYRKRLTERVAEAVKEFNVTIEPADFVKEVAVFADRCDISEETVRLRSHLDQFASAMRLEESAGRKLEFICQEMGRETNTIGSKANDAEISQQVVAIKTALERIREQVQNVQ
ncbi:MAG: YicC/YloC family endoribonuclease [Planctomycetota bacterium]